MLDFLKSKSVPQSQSPEQLFESHLTTLVKRGCPPSIVESFDRSKAKILAHALLVTMGEGHIPFLPVITPCYLGYYGLMAMVRNKKQGGIVECEIERIVDTESVPSRLYYIFDVEGGMEWEGRPPEIAHTLICQNGRLPVTTAEAVSMALFTDVLVRHSLNAVGSRYASDRTPMVWLNVAMPVAVPNSMHWTNTIEGGASLLKSELGKPALGWWYSSSPSQSGAPSCASRLEIK